MNKVIIAVWGIGIILAGYIFSLHIKLDKDSYFPVEDQVNELSISDEEFYQLLGISLEQVDNLEQENVETENNIKVTELDNSSINSITASSSLDGYNTEYINDGLLETSWVEGKNDNGIGEYLLILFDNEYLMNGLCIYSGYHKTEEIYYKNSRPNSLELEFSDGTVQIVELEDLYQVEQVIEFEQPIYTSYVKIIIKEVYFGNTYEDTCISEIQVY